MGTSSSSSGSATKSPLLPPWVDDNGPAPDETKSAQRFRSFRTKLGQFVRSGDKDDLRKAVGKFASTATGGAAIASRRFSPMAMAGGQLISTINELREGGDGTREAGIDLTACIGADTDIAIDLIADALTPSHGDGELIRAALTAALDELLGNDPEFDPTNLLEGQVLQLFEAYVVEAVFLWIVNESDKAFQKTSSVPRANQAEKDLRELTKVVVEEVISNKGLEGIKQKSGTEIAELQKEVVFEVMSIWEGYDD